MATIGTITVVFNSEVAGLQAGVKESISLLEQLDGAVRNSTSYRISADFSDLTSGLDASLKAFEDLASRAESLGSQIESLSSQKLVADTSEATEAVEEVADAVDSVREEVGEPLVFRAQAGEVLKAASEAALAVREVRGSTLAVQSLGAARNSVLELTGSFRGAARAVSQFDGTAQSTINTAAALYSAWVRGAGAVDTAAGAYKVLSGVLPVINRAAQSEQELARVVTQGGSAFARGAAASSLSIAGTRGLEAATSRLNPQLRESVRLLGGLAVNYAATAASARVGAASEAFLSASLRSRVSPLSAVAAFSRTYSDGLARIAETSTAAADRQAFFTSVVSLGSNAMSRLSESATSTFQPLITGYTRAREAGDGYFSAVARGVRGQISSLSIARRSTDSLSSAFTPFATGFSRARAEGLSFFAAIDRGLSGQLNASSAFRSTVEAITKSLSGTRLAGFFEPLITGFTRAREAGGGFISAVARGIQGQLLSSSAFRGLADGLRSTGEAFARFAGQIVGVNAKTQLGRDAYAVVRTAIRAVGTTAVETAQRFRVLGEAIANGFRAFPAGQQIVESLSNGYRSLVRSASSAAGSSTILSTALKAVATGMAVASVAGGRFSGELQHMAREAQEIQNLSDRFGASTQEIEKLRFAAASSGVSLNQLAKGQQNLYTSLSKIRLGQINTENTQEAKLAFDKLGISIDDLKSKSPQQTFEEIAKKLTAIKDPADRTAIAFDLFGKQGAAILPALKSLGQVEEDVERLDVTTSRLDFSRLENLSTSFSRLTRATASLREAQLTAYSELQAGFNNFFADVRGGLATLTVVLSSTFADFTKPIAVVLEVFGRVINIILRLAASVARVAAAFSIFPVIARFAEAVGAKLKQLLEIVEELVSVADKLSTAFYEALVPMNLSEAIASGKTLNQQLASTGVAFAATIASAGAFKAAAELAGLQPGRAFQRLAALVRLPSLATLRAAFVTFGSGALSVLKTIVVGFTQTAINVTAASVKIIATFIAMRVQAVAGWLIPSLAAMLSFVTGINATAIATRLAALSMAASWVIATAGLALILIAAVAIYENFDKLSDYFENFSENVGKLFTFEGLTEALSSVGSALLGSFKSIFLGISDLAIDVVNSIIRAFAEIEPPPQIEATSATAEEIVANRQRVAEVEQETRNANQLSLSSLFGGEAARSVAPPPEDTQRLIQSITQAREEMDSLMIASAKSGEGGAKAADSIGSSFDKLQNQLAAGKISIEDFEAQAAKLGEDLRKNLKYFDEENAAAARQKNREFFKSLNDLVKESAKQIREVQAGSVVEGVFFPTSDAIKSQADRVQADYERELEAIKQKQQRGEFGAGDAGRQNASIAVEDAQRRQKRAMDEIGRDVSFADDIRQALTKAFLTPVMEFEDRMKKIAENKSLSDIQKGLAMAAERKQFIEQNFGKTAGESLRERGKAVDIASRPDASGYRMISATRESTERTKLEIDRRQAAGLDATRDQMLKSGVDRINDAFNVTTQSMDELRQSMSPEVFAEYTQALKQNSDSVSDSFMSAIGVTKTPFEKFSRGLDTIASQFGMAGQSLDKVRESLQGNAEGLALFDRAVKQSRDDLLASLGVEKTPQQVFDETMKKIEEAYNAKDPSKRIDVLESLRAQNAAEMKRNQSLGVDGLFTRTRPYLDKKREIEEAFGSRGEDNPVAYASAMRNLGRSIPGGEAETPLEKFKKGIEDLEFLRDVDFFGRGEEGQREFAQRKLMLQAQLQEDLKPSLDMIAPDRRGIQGSDARSKEGVDTFFRILRGNDNPSLKAQLEVARNTRIIADASQNRDAAPVIAQLSVR